MNDRRAESVSSGCYLTCPCRVYRERKINLLLGLYIVVQGLPAGGLGTGPAKGSGPTRERQTA